LLAFGPDDFPDGPTYQAALNRFKEITELGSANFAKDRNTCRIVCELYMRWLSERRRAKTVRTRQDILRAFTDALGDLTVSELTHHRVYEWLDQMRKPRRLPKSKREVCWSGGTLGLAVLSLQAAFNWAARSGLITKNPLKGLERPSAHSRGRLALLGQTHEERQAVHGKLLRGATASLRQILVVLEATGARPGELVHATASDFDPKLGAIVYHAEDSRIEGEFRHKTAGRGKTRTIFLTGDALELVRRLAAERPRGQLFCTLGRCKGRPSAWSVEDLAGAFRTLCRKLSFPHLTPYSYRHTLATAWLEQGKSVDVLAELLGNTPAIIRKHYSHLFADTGNLRRQLEAFKAPNGAGKKQSLPEEPSPAFGVVG
jgi:integrase